jgi:heterodisulfide reductase subunit D
LEELLKEYYDEMLRCTRCGFCQATCPTYSVLRRESATARGKIQLLLGVVQKRLPMSAAVSRHVYSCMDCRSCFQNCPGGVRAYDIFSLARRALAGTEYFPTQLVEMDRRVETEHNISGEDNAHRLLWQENLEHKPDGLVGKEQAEVLFFVGCVSSLYPRVYAIPQSFVEVLEAAQVNYTTLGGEEWCCGYPLLTAGLNVDDLIEHNLAEARRLGVKKIVMTCPSCHHTWHEHYPSGEFEVLHATQYLAELVENDKLPLRELKQSVTYHDPCDLGRKSDEFDAPRRILKAIPGLEFVEMTNSRANAICCGGGGNQESLNPDLAAAVGSQRLAEAQGTGAKILVSACQQCERTLSMAARRDKVRMKVMDITELVCRALDTDALR